MSMREHRRVAHRMVDAKLAALLMCLLFINSFSQGVDAVDTGDTAPRLGVELSLAEIDNLPLHVFSDGEGLPAGSGTPEKGAELYAQHCASCHGSVGQGGKAIELVGDRSLLTTEYPDKGIGVYWPYAPTLFEYIHRSMPPDNPALFSPDELYSLVAHLLDLSGLIDEGAMMDAEALRSIEMPNRTGFITVAE